MLASPTTPSSPAGVANCVALAAIPRVPVAPLDIRDLGDGTRRVSSAEGGYAIVVPGHWLVSGSWAGGLEPSFAQTHMSSYDPKAAPPSRPEAGTILPPEVGIRFDIELWANLLNESPDVYAKRLHIGPDQVAVLAGSYVNVNGQQAYRLTIQDERRFQPTTGPLITTRQTRAVWLVPSPRADRMLLLYATPAENALLTTVERAVRTLQVMPPASAVVPVTKQRSEIRDQWLVGKSGPIAGRRVEAKLMTYAEASIALHGRQGTSPATPMGILRIDRDPDELFWLVAVSGPDLPQGRGGPHAGTPPPTSWMLYNAPATDARVSGGTGGSYSSSGNWPPQFDALPDRCH